MSDDIRRKLERLRREIEKHSRLYFVDSKPEISDLEFDKLVKQLEKLEAEHPEYDSPDSPTHKVGGEPIDGFETFCSARTKSSTPSSTRSTASPCRWSTTTADSHRH
jgi:NAD-dependent DNA ligase